MLPNSYHLLKRHHRLHKLRFYHADLLMQILLQFHHSKKVRLKHVNFQQHHAHSHYDLDSQLFHRVDVAFQIQLFAPLITYEHNFDGLYQRQLHPLVIEKFYVVRLLTQQHQGLALSDRQILIPAQLKKI